MILTEHWNFSFVIVAVGARRVSSRALGARAPDPRDLGQLSVLELLNGTRQANRVGFGGRATRGTGKTIAVLYRCGWQLALDRPLARMGAMRIKRNLSAQTAGNESGGRRERDREMNLARASRKLSKRKLLAGAWRAQRHSLSLFPFVCVLFVAALWPKVAGARFGSGRRGASQTISWSDIVGFISSQSSPGAGKIQRDNLE